MSEIIKNIIFGDASLQEYYQMEGDSTDSKNNNDGTNNGTITYVVSKYGRGANSDGSSGTFISIPRINIGAAGSFSCWAKVTGAAGTDASYAGLVVQLNGGASTGENRLLVNISGGNILTQCYDSGGQKSINITPALAAVNNLRHYGLTWNSTTLRLYYQGFEIGNTAMGAMTGSGTAVRLFEGGGDNVNFRMIGDIDDIAIFNKAITASEMYSLFAERVDLRNKLRPAIFTPGLAR